MALHWRKRHGQSSRCTPEPLPLLSRLSSQYPPQQSDCRTLALCPIIVTTCIHTWLKQVVTNSETIRYLLFLEIGIGSGKWRNLQPQQELSSCTEPCTCYKPRDRLCGGICSLYWNRHYFDGSLLLGNSPRAILATINFACLTALLKAADMVFRLSTASISFLVVMAPATSLILSPNCHCVLR